MIRILLMTLLLSAEVLAQVNTAKVSGYVYDAKNGEAAAFCDVSLRGSKLHTQTDFNGYFKIDSIPAGNYVLNLFYVGYEPLDTNLQFQEKDQIKLKFYLESGNFNSSWGGEIQAYQEPLIDLFQILNNYHKDTILKEKIIPVEDCNTGLKYSLIYWETGNIKHLKKDGEWFGYWDNGNLCYKAKYKQKLKFKKVLVQKVIKNERNLYRKKHWVYKFRFRYWVIPIDSLFEYNYNGTLRTSTYFSKRGKMINPIINYYDDNNRLRETFNTKKFKRIQYCVHGIVADSTGMASGVQMHENDPPITTHRSTCRYCFIEYYLCPLAPYEETLSPRRMRF